MAERGWLMINISSEHHIHRMSKENEPAVYCKSGDIVIINTLDCFSNKLLPKDAKLGVDNPSLGNPATGPIYVKGAMPGDTLKVEIIDILVGDVGVSIAGPTSSCLQGRISELEVRRIPVANGIAKISNNLSLPVKPMIGVIGVAPADNSIPTVIPGKHGGNMDCSQIKKGAILYLPVFTEGALLAIGDLHALMGDGEISECGLEIEGTVIIRISVLPRTFRTAPAVCVDKKWITIASCETLDKAAEEANNMMLDFLIDEVGIDANDASVILGLCGNLVVCQLCNPYKTVRMELALDCIAYTGYLPA